MFETRQLKYESLKSTVEEFMKRKSIILVVIVCIFLGFMSSLPVLAQGCGCSSQQESIEELALEACTVVIVGKKASADGSVIVTQTADCGICDFSWRYIPAADHEPGSKRKIYWFSQFETSPPDKGYHWGDYEHKFNGLEIDEVEHTFGYLHGMFGYLNENQVAFGESTIGCRRQLRNNTPSPKFDITMLSLIAMERATTARQAIQIMGDLSVKYGYGHTDSGEMLAVSDTDEAWIFEIMPVGPLWTPDSGQPGAVWCAQRVPDDHVSICPNESRIGDIDMNDEDNFMFSENVMSLAIDMGLYDPDGGKPFSWKHAYSPSENSAAASNGGRARAWRFFSLMAPSKNFSPETPNMDFPFSVKPEEKLSVTDVFGILRDNYEGTPYDPAKGIMGGPFKNPNYLFRGVEVDGKRYGTPRSIGINNSEFTTVVQTRDWLPDPIGGVLWLGLGALNTNCFIPFYAGVNGIPKSFQFGDHWEFDRRVARWAFDYTDFHAQVAYSYAIQDVREAQKRWETAAVERTKDIDDKALKLHKESHEKAGQYLTQYCCDNANAVVNAWWKLGDDLLVKYNKLRRYDVEERRARRLEYPEEWVKALVKIEGMKPQPERRR
jgi:dipeptidase